ncbi:IclR family transcriptional regulator [Sinorhizobium alkalisoli]|uniref:IclR family transcriptional regulator n=1 Tax=Sinorhizobium alkalisoli TaxID=1752398 RepID=UPI0012A900AC|nr:IclR family transcriptional regulator [Sinorhizobium alkalisoli]QFI68745.1 Transcriptional regulator, IclR family [Sinorhizobium alkalisoli]
MNLQERKTAKGKAISPSETRESGQTVRAKAGARSRPAGLNRSVTRALDLLLDVAHSPAPKSFVDLQKHHRVPKATLHKLLFTLEVLNFIRRDEDSGKYSLGLAAMEISAAGAAGPGDLAMILRPVLQRLVQESDETCHLGILSGGEEVILSRIDPEAQIVRLAPQIGRRHPAYASAGGLASMALKLDETVITSMPEELRQLTKNTIKTRTELLARLDEVREKGYALDMEEAYVGVRCVGVAVAVPHWPVVHVSLSVPLQRAPIERLHALVKPLMAAAKEIERILIVTPRA